MDPGRVHERDLGSRPAGDPEDPLPGRLRLVRDDRDFLADEAVHESGLADVRPPDDRDLAGIETEPSAIGSQRSALRGDFKTR